MFRNKSFLKKTMEISIPIAFQSLLSIVVNMIDTIMIGQLGEATVAAIGLANKFFFVFNLLMSGICSGSSILAAQYWGKREPENISKTLQLSLFIGVGASLLFTIIGALFPTVAMRVFTPEEETIRIGATYLCIVALSYPITAVTSVYVAILRSMNYVKLPVIITIIAIGVNATLNYGLIFGNFGMPKMGAAGAALATLIARIVECGVLLLIVYLHKAGDQGLGDFIHKRYQKEIVGKFQIFNKGFVMKYFSTASPVIANEFMWGLGVTMYSLVYGRMGNSAMAAITIEGTMEQMITVFFFGLCASAAVILGNVLGSNDLEKAKEYAKNFLTLQLLLSTLAAIITIIIRNPVIALFAQSDLVADYIGKTVLIFAFLLPIKMINSIIIISILRSGGDSKAALFLDVTAVWFFGIPMAVLGGLILKLPIYLVYAMVNTEEIYKFILGLIRYRKKKWVRNIVA